MERKRNREIERLRMRRKKIGEAMEGRNVKIREEQGKPEKKMNKNSNTHRLIVHCDILSRH